MAKQKRRNTFTVDAESIQGMEGATITFKRLKRRTWLEWRADPNSKDDDLVQSHVLSWSGILDAEGNELPSPQDEPAAVGELFFEEVPAITGLLIKGPTDLKN